MKTLLLFIVLFMANGLLAQHAHVYYPNGDRYSGEAHSLEKIIIEMEPEGRVYHFSPFVLQGDDLTTVGFLLFTDSPLWVMTEKPSLIDSAINQFDLHKFYQSPEFKIELDAFIAKGVLTKSFLERSLGTPSKKRNFKTKDGEFDRWTYDDHNMDLIIEDDVVTHRLAGSR